MDNTNPVPIPAAILLYVGAATTLTNIIVNGVRMSARISALTSFVIAVIMGIAFVALFMIANSAPITSQNIAGAIIAGVMVGGASAGINAVHSNTKPTAKRVP